MDLAYLRTHPEHLPTFLTHQRIRETPVPGGSATVASRLTLDDGTSVFLKSWPDSAGITSRPDGTGTPPRPGDTVTTARPDTTAAPSGYFAAEAAGLAWLREAGGVPTPEVIVALPNLIALEWLDEAVPTASAARAFGAALALTHRAGSAHFGAGWPGYIGSLPLDNTPSTGPWSHWFGERRLLPYLRMSRDRGSLSTADVAIVERLVETIDRYAGAADAEPPARLHGDLWPGNLLWSATGVVYAIDPAAHGGHRESDLAQLALFGAAPYLVEIIAGYQHVWPLSDGWAHRVALHQLHLLLVHTAIFGAGYRDSVLSAVRATVKQ